MPHSQKYVRTCDTRSTSELETHNPGKLIFHCDVKLNAEAPLECRLLQRLAKEDPPAFLCHFYNIYFAHSAGGRMIGKKVGFWCRSLMHRNDPPKPLARPYLTHP